MTTYTESNNFRCDAQGTYDTENNLVDITTCSRKFNDARNGVTRLAAGQKLYVESVYRQDHLPHYGVMSMSFVYAHIPRQEEVQV